MSVNHRETMDLLKFHPNLSRELYDHGPFRQVARKDGDLEGGPPESRQVPYPLQQTLSPADGSRRSPGVVENQVGSLSGASYGEGLSDPSCGSGDDDVFPAKTQLECSRTASVIKSA